MNCGNDAITLMLPNRETIPFRPNESIQVLLGRKYSPDGLRRMFASCQLNELAFEEDMSHAAAPHAGRSADFGLAMVVLQHEPTAAPPVTPLRRVWDVPVQPAPQH